MYANQLVTPYFSSVHPLSCCGFRAVLPHQKTHHPDLNPSLPPSHPSPHSCINCHNDNLQEPPSPNHHTWELVSYKIFGEARNSTPVGVKLCKESSLERRQKLQNRLAAALQPRHPLLARPLCTLMWATGASVRISAPDERAAPAIAALTDPLPPLANPQARNAPSISPM